MGGESPDKVFAVVGANGAVAFRVTLTVFTVVTANVTVIDFVTGEAVLGVESASGAVFVTIAIVFAITMSEVALADDTSTSVRDKAFIEGANATVAVGSVFTVVSADAAVADLVDSPFGTQ